MNKPKRSVLIEQVLHHVDKGLITARPDSSAESVLERLCVALRAIMDGADPDTALGIERAPGRSGTLQREMLCWVHLLREQGEYWSVIEHRINLWRKHRGLDGIKVNTLQRLYRDHKDAISSEFELMRLLRG